MGCGAYQGARTKSAPSEPRMPRPRTQSAVRRSYSPPPSAAGHSLLFGTLVAMLQRRSRLGQDAAATSRLASQVSLCRPGGLIPQLPTDPVQNAAADELKHRPQTPEAVALHRLPLGAL